MGLCYPLPSAGIPPPRSAVRPPFDKVGSRFVRTCLQTLIYWCVAISYPINPEKIAKTMGMVIIDRACEMTAMPAASEVS